jgi:hypothetical protein
MGRSWRTDGEATRYEGAKDPLWPRQQTLKDGIELAEQAGRKSMKDGMILKRIITGVRAVGGFPLLLSGPLRGLSPRQW